MPSLKHLCFLLLFWKDKKELKWQKVFSFLCDVLLLLLIFHQLLLLIENLVRSTNHALFLKYLDLCASDEFSNFENCDVIINATVFGNVHFNLGNTILLRLNLSKQLYYIWWIVQTSFLKKGAWKRIVKSFMITEQWELEYYKNETGWL